MNLVKFSRILCYLSVRHLQGLCLSIQRYLSRQPKNAVGSIERRQLRRRAAVTASHANVTDAPPLQQRQRVLRWSKRNRQQS